MLFVAHIHEKKGPIHKIKIIFKEYVMPVIINI